jgi:hypothetical protein
MADENELSRSGWIRQQLLMKPDLSFEELLAAYDKSGRPKSERPKDQQALYQARSQLMQRWHFKSLDDIPRTTANTLNMAGLVRQYLSIFRSGTFETAAKFFAADGLELKSATWHNAKSGLMKNVEAQPDANHDAGPRAGKPEEAEEAPRRNGRRKGRRKGGRRAKLVVDADSALGRYQEIEKDLDRIIEAAEALKNWQLAEELRNARRRAGAGILQYS